VEKNNHGERKAILGSCAVCYDKVHQLVQGLLFWRKWRILGDYRQSREGRSLPIDLASDITLRKKLKRADMLRMERQVSRKEKMSLRSCLGTSLFSGRKDGKFKP